MNEKTSKKTASKAGRILRDPNSTPDERSVAASALTQVGESENPALSLLADHVRELLIFVRKSDAQGVDLIRGINNYLAVFENDIARIDKNE